MSFKSPHMKTRIKIHMKAREFNRFKKWVLKYTRVRSETVFDASKLVLVNGLSKSEAAREVGITPQAVGQGVKKLKGLLKDYDAWLHENEVDK